MSDTTMLQVDIFGDKYFVRGRVNTDTYSILEDALLESDINLPLVLDFSDVVYISSAGFRVLLKEQKRRNSDNKIVLVNMSEDIFEIFSVTGFCDIFDIRR